MTDEHYDAEDGMQEQPHVGLVPFRAGPFDNDLFQAPPSAVVETASLALMTLPATSTKLLLPRQTMLAHLSQDQLLAVALCLERHNTVMTTGKRCGFLLGDGTGVGKTRTAGAVIFSYVLSHVLRYERAPPCLWVSANMDLMPAAQRELAEIGAGRLMCVSAKEFLRPPARGAPPPHVVFSTYAYLSRNSAAVLQRLPADYDGVVVLDECHMAKNMAVGDKRWSTAAKTTSSAAAVHALQERCPRARIVYVTATAATEPRHFCNMSRLGLWGDGTAFATPQAFVQQMERHGLGSMEMVALHMKQHGEFVSRHLSFSQCEFDIVSVAPDAEYAAMYDRCVRVWQLLEDRIEDFQCPDKEARLARMRRMFYMELYGVFRMLMLSAKMPTLVRLVQAALGQGRACVIGMEQTGQAAMAQRDDASDDLFSAVEVRMLRFVETYFQPKVSLDFPSAIHVCSAWYFQACLAEPCCRAQDPQVKRDVVQKVKDIRLPPNPLDDLIERLGGVDCVAEVSSRTHRFVRVCRDKVVMKHGAVHTVQDESWARVGRSASKTDELNSFQDGAKRVCVVTRAGQVGADLHADPRRPEAGQRRRQHFIVEIPSNPESLLQQLGRTHRKNEVSAPVYTLLMSTLGGEIRFASGIAGRMQAMGALTQGDRRCAGQLGAGFQDFAINPLTGGKAAKAAAEALDDPHNIQTSHVIPVPPLIAQGAGIDPEVWRSFSQRNASNAWRRMNKPKDPLTTFFNCLMACTVSAQAEIFAVFAAFLEHYTLEARRKGDTGGSILDVVGANITVDKTEVLTRCPETSAVTSLMQVSTDRGLDFATAAQMLQDHGPDDISGFYKDQHQVSKSIKSLCAVCRELTSLTP